MIKQNCAHCGLTYQCICHLKPQLDTQFQFALLTHENELNRATNTGQLISHVFSKSQVHVYLWQRKNPPQALLQHLQSQCIIPVLLYPSEACLTTSEIKKNVADIQAKNQHNQPKANAQLLFILLDATWQEANKMINKSPWLNGIPHLKIDTDKPSCYTLRRNQKEGNLCTCEVAIELLEQFGESENAAHLQNYMLQYLEYFKADRSGHILKINR